MYKRRCKLDNGLYIKKLFQFHNIDVPKAAEFHICKWVLTFFLWCTAAGLQIQRYYWLTLTLVYNYTNQTNILFLNLTQNQNFDHDEHNWWIFELRIKNFAVHQPNHFPFGVYSLPDTTAEYSADSGVHPCNLIMR